MPIIVTDGIVTRYVNYRESDRIISIFTPDRGRLDAKARGCRKPTSALLAGCQPFVYGQFELYVSHDKFTVNQCAVKETFFPLREDYRRFAAASAMLQLAHDAVQENEANPPLFSLLYHALSYLCYGSVAPMDLTCCFLIRFLNIVGYRPTITACAHCARDIRSDAVLRFSPRTGGVVCAACAPSDATPIGKTSLEALRRMLLLADDEMDRVKLTDALRAELLPTLQNYASATLDYGAKALAALNGADVGA